MKTNNLIERSGETKYSRPEVARFDVAVERGFAISGVANGMIPSIEEDGFGDY